MGRIFKKRKEVFVKYDFLKVYILIEVCDMVKVIIMFKFDVLVDISVCLGVDLCKVNQMVCGIVVFLYGIGKDVCVFVFCILDKEVEVKVVGVEYVGFDDFIDKIKGGWIDIDVIIMMLLVMGKVGVFG